MLATPLCARQPTISPQATIITVPIRPSSTSAPVQPNGTAERATGMARKRSITPRAASEATVSVVLITAVKAIIAYRPGIRYSR